MATFALFLVSKNLGYRDFKRGTTTTHRGQELIIRVKQGLTLLQRVNHVRHDRHHHYLHIERRHYNPHSDRNLEEHERDVVFQSRQNYAHLSFSILVDELLLQGFTSTGSEWPKENVSSGPARGCKNKLPDS